MSVSQQQDNADRQARPQAGMLLGKCSDTREQQPPQQEQEQLVSVGEVDLLRRTRRLAFADVCWRMLAHADVC